MIAFDANFDQRVAEIRNELGCAGLGTIEEFFWKVHAWLRPECESGIDSDLISVPAGKLEFLLDLAALGLASLRDGFMDDVRQVWDEDTYWG